MDMVANPNKLSVVAWLLVCPILLVAAIFVFPQFNQLHGSLIERYALLALMALPLVGVVGIFRHRQSTLLIRLVFSACYLLVGLVMALFAVIFIGCSWAAACF